MPTLDPHDQSKRASHPEPEGGDAHQPIMRPDCFPGEWLRQVAARKIDETVEEPVRALKGRPEIFDATVLGAPGR